jgi:cytochrome P450 family 710 subfamily A protein
VGNFTMFVTEAEAVRKVLTENGPDGFTMVLHPSGKRILGDNNIAFMHGPRHKALRHSFLQLFGRKALGLYLHLQEVRRGDSL